jgi:hypothetical protein
VRQQTNAERGCWTGLSPERAGKKLCKQTVKAACEMELKNEAILLLGPVLTQGTDLKIHPCLWEEPLPRGIFCGQCRAMGRPIPAAIPLSWSQAIEEKAETCSCVRCYPDTCHPSKATKGSECSTILSHFLIPSPRHWTGRTKQEAEHTVTQDGQESWESWAKVLKKAVITCNPGWATVKANGKQGWRAYEKQRGVGMGKLRFG